MKQCDAPDCEKAPRSPGSPFCENHYYRMRKYGSLELPTRTFIKDATCEAADCDKQAKTRGYCGKHAERVRRHGSPDVEVLVWNDPERRFWKRVDKTDTCWLWTGALTYDGYGIFGVKEERTGAHRWAWRFKRGEIPEGLHLDHLCRVRNCVNPDHLEPVTIAENNRRMWEVR